MLIGCALAVLDGRAPGPRPPAVTRALAVIASSRSRSARRRGSRPRRRREFFFGGDTLSARVRRRAVLVPGRAHEGAGRVRAAAARLARRHLVRRLPLALAGHRVPRRRPHRPLRQRAQRAARGRDSWRLGRCRSGSSSGPSAIPGLRDLRWAVPATVVATRDRARHHDRRHVTAPSSPSQNGGHPCPPAAERRRRRRTKTWTSVGVPDVPALQGKNITVIGDSRACSLLVGFDAAGRSSARPAANGAGARLRRGRRAVRRVRPHPGRMARPLPRRVPRRRSRGSATRPTCSCGGRHGRARTCSSVTRSSSRGRPEHDAAPPDRAWSSGWRRRSPRA